MERIPFDIKFRPEIEAGKYLVQTRGGEPARIICWDRAGYFPIVALVQNNESESTFIFSENGEYDEMVGRSVLDLFLVPNPDYKEPTTTCSTSVDWDAFRREAAKEFVGAILSNSALADDRSWDYRVNVIGTGVAYADELIEQLKEGKK